MTERLSGVDPHPKELGARGAGTSPRGVDATDEGGEDIRPAVAGFVSGIRTAVQSSQEGIRAPLAP